MASAQEMPVFVAGNGIDKPARRATQADALHEYYMNSGQLPRPIGEVRAGSGPQSVTNLLQYLYTKPAPLPAKPSGSSATYQQGNKKACYHEGSPLTWHTGESRRPISPIPL